MPPHNFEPLRQRFIRSVASKGNHLRLVVSNEPSAADWLISVGPLAARRNRESKFDPSGDAA